MIHKVLILQKNIDLQRSDSDTKVNTGKRIDDESTELKKYSQAQWYCIH